MQKEVTIEELREELRKLYHSMFIIGEVCVEESKQHISSERAINKIRESIYWNQSSERFRLLGE